LSKSADEGCKLCFILKAGFNQWANAGYPIWSRHTLHTMRYTNVEKDEDESNRNLRFVLVLRDCEFVENEDSPPSTHVTGFELHRGIFGSNNRLDLGQFDVGPFFQILGPVGK
jgi:hypothetical protein